MQHHERVDLVRFDEGEGGVRAEGDFGGRPRRGSHSRGEASDDAETW